MRKLRVFYSTLFLLVAASIATWFLVYARSSERLVRIFDQENIATTQTMVGTTLIDPGDRGLTQSKVWVAMQNCTRAIGVLEKWKGNVTVESFPLLMSNCSYVKDLFANGLRTSSVEEDFPLAFLMTVHNSPWQVVRLLRVIFRPHNVYCIHVDSKASQSLINGFRNMATCLDNVVVPERLVEIVYKFGSSVLEAQLSCWETLLTLQESWKWKYVINLCGTELPYLTNGEITRALISVEGSSVFHVSDLTKKEREKRFLYSVELNPINNKLMRSKHYLGPVPHGIRLYKASTYMAASHEFVQFIVTNQKAQDLRTYMCGAVSPEEHFYISLYALPEAPKAGNIIDHGIIVSKSFWDQSCSKAIRFVCILGMAELDRIKSFTQNGRTVFFFNKYLAEYDSQIMDFMEGALFSRSLPELQSGCHQ